MSNSHRTRNRSGRRKLPELGVRSLFYLLDGDDSRWLLGYRAAGGPGAYHWIEEGGRVHASDRVSHWREEPAKPKAYRVLAKAAERRPEMPVRRKAGYGSLAYMSPERLRAAVEGIAAGAEATPATHFDAIEATA